MSEAAARFRQPIDLDDFEQRLRAGTPSSTPASSSAPIKADDPLAELARLVGQADPFRAATVPPQLRPAAGRSVTAPVRPAPHLQQVHPPLDRADPPFETPAPALSEEQIMVAAPAALQLHSFEQPLPYEPVYAVGEAGPYAVTPAEAAAGEDGGLAPEALPHVAPAAIASATGEEMPRRSWRGVIILSTVLATGFVGLAAALTMKHSLSGGSAGTARNGSGPPVILAGGPTKIQPPANAADVPDDQPSVLDKTASTKPANAKIVDNVEQPVDLSQQPAGAAPAAAAALSTDAGAVTNKPAAPQQTASLDPVAATPGPMGSRDGADAVAKRAENDPPPSPARNGFPEPRRVKVVSVRPDGSIIGGDPDAQAAARPDQPAGTRPPPPISLGVAMPQAADPMAQQAPPADEARADAPMPSPQAEKPATDGDRGHDAVAALIDSSKGGQPAAQAGGEVRNADAADPTAAPKAKRAHKKDTEVADLGNQDASNPDKAKPAGQDAAAEENGGKFAAQLAASPTESAAKATLRKLKRKYGETFGSHKLTYRRVKVDGKTVYRVRLTGLTKDDANAVCSKLQDDGGTCFVAH